MKAGPRPPAEAVGLVGYAWDQRMRWGRGAYRDLSTGHVISQAAVEGLLRDVIDISEQAMREYGEMAARGEMTPQDFYQSMRESTRLAMNAAAALSKGGWAQMTQADWGRNGWLLRQQYEYLAGFVNDLATEMTPAGTRGKLTPEQAQARAMLYADSAWGRFWELEDAKQAALAGTEAKIQTVGDDRVCEICRGEEAQGYRPLAETPALPIHPGCRCRKVYRVVKLDQRMRRRRGAWVDESGGMVNRSSRTEHGRGTDGVGLVGPVGEVGERKHYGPGPHPSGSGQEVHGRKRDGAAGPETGQEAEAKRLQILTIQQGYEQDRARLTAEWEGVKRRLQEDLPAAERRRWIAEAASIEGKLLELDRKREDAMLAALASDQPLPITVERLTGFNDKRQQAIAEGVALFRNLVDVGVLPAGAKPVADFKASRQFRSEFLGGVIMVGVKADRLAVVHELGHWLEAVQPVIHDQCVQFYEERTAGWPLQKLRVAARNQKYGPDEITKVDRFLDPYMGKEYVDADGRRQATEILSMGLPYFLTRPHELAAGDPEYFRFVYDTVRGRW